MFVRVQLQLQQAVLSIISQMEQCAVSNVLRFRIERVALAIVRRWKWNKVIARAVHAVVHTSDQHRAQWIERVFERIIPIDLVLEEVSNVRRLQGGEGLRVVASGDVQLAGVGEKGFDEPVEAKRGIVADGDGRKGLWPFFGNRDERLCWILEIRFDRFKDEVEHDAGVGDETNRPEDAILWTSTACNARKAVRRRVQSEFSNDRPAPRYVDFGPRCVVSHWGHASCILAGCLVHC